MSEERESRGTEGAGLRAVGNGQLWDGSNRMVEEQREGCGLDVGVKRFL